MDNNRVDQKSMQTLVDDPKQPPKCQKMVTPFIC